MGCWSRKREPSRPHLQIAHVVEISKIKQLNSMLVKIIGISQVNVLNECLHSLKAHMLDNQRICVGVFGGLC